MIKKYSLVFTILLCTSFILHFNSSYGQSIFENEITGTNPSNDNPYTIGQIVNPNITVSGIGRGPQITARNANNRYNAGNWAGAAFNPDQYFEFIITPTTGVGIDFINFMYTSQASATGPASITFRSSVDNFTSDIGAATINGTTIDLSAIDFQNITDPITFRLFAWNASGNSGTFSINDFVFNGTIVCPNTTTWDGTTWNPMPPDIDTRVIINGNYNTNDNGGSFSACSLIVNSGTLFISNANHIEVMNDVIVNGGTITTATRGSFVQNGDGNTAGVFTVNSGTTQVRKTTSDLANWFDYTYWSSPVENETTDVLFPASLIFSFNSSNFIDVNGDGIDDDANAWTDATANVPMTPGQGFAATSNPISFNPMMPATNVTFNGSYNTGDITFPVIYNSTNDATLHWNLIGNPYPSAIDIDAFFTTNSGILGQAIYMWSHVSPPSRDNIGNEVLNFNQNDYITVNFVGEAGNGSDGVIPERKVPSGQSFFIPSIISGNATFTNSMRVSGDNANDLFFRGSKSLASKTNTSTHEKLWLNLSSDIGIFSQICIAYTDFSTNEYDGNSIDTPRNYAGNAGILYSLIESEKDTPFVIQGKAASSLNIEENIKIGFGAYISTEETYTIDLLKTEGEFLTSNSIYLKDNYLDVIHDISASHYTFTSQGGTFNDRFELVFTSNTLSVDENTLENTSLVIIELNNGNVQFTVKNSSLIIEAINLYDIQGRLVYELEGNASTEIYNISNLNSSAYIAKVHLSNGQTITKKSIKK